MVLWNLQPRFSTRLVGIPFQDLQSLVHAPFNVKEAIAQGLWTDTAPPLDNKGKKSIGSSSRPGKVDTINYQHQRPAHHSPYRSPTVRAHLSHPQYQYHLVYVQQHYIAQASMQPRPPHLRVTTLPPPKPYTQRPTGQFTPLGMTLTRAFEKLRNAGLIVPLALYPLLYPIPLYFRLHEHCSFHHTQGYATNYCSTLHNAIQNLIDSGLVNLSGPRVTTNPLPTHSTHAVLLPLSLQQIDLDVDDIDSHMTFWDIPGEDLVHRHGYIILQQFSSEHFSF